MPAFFWIGNHHGLDFVNTAAADDRGEPVELLNGYNAFTNWLDQAGLVAPSVVRAVPELEREQLLDWARRLRTAARNVLDPQARDASGARALDTVVAEVPVRLAYSNANRHLAPIEAHNPKDRVRLALALAVLEATSLAVARVRRCGRDGCVLLFFDTSKNNSRRWCDMAACGNRVKASAHYHRHRADPSPDT